MSGTSLRLRLIAGGIAAIVLALAIAGAGLTILFQRHVARSIGEDLDVHLRQLLAGLDIDSNGRLVVTREPTDPRFMEALSGLYWQVEAGSDSLLRSRSLWDARLTLPDDAISPGETHRHEAAGPASKRVLIAERMVRFTSSPSKARVAVAIDIARIERAGSAFARELAAALGLLGLVLAIATALQVGVGLRPLARLRKDIADIRSGRAQRLPTTAPIEVRPLATEINGLLDAQEREGERARGRAADLAHGLKTPLAALAGDVERLRKLGQAGIARDIEQVGDTMRRHVDRELTRARLRGSDGRRAIQPAHVVPLARSIAAMLERAPLAHPVRIDIDVDLGARLLIDRDDLAEVLGNLMENAARHARSLVRVRMHDDEGRQVLTIDDDGPGIAPEARAAMLERGGRLDTSGGGAGLGLAMVQDVLVAYGWEIELSGSDLGGLSARIQPRRL